MAQDKVYASIIDEILDDREPDWEDAGLKEAHKSGEDVLKRTGKYVDDSFLDDIAEGSSHHTELPSDSKSATLLNRLAEKESAASRLGTGQRPQTRMANRPEDYRSEVGDNESLFSEVTMSVEQAEKGASEGRKQGVEGRNQSDAEIKAYVKKLLNQGVAPKRVAALVEKVAEIELLNKKDNMGMNYLNENQGLLGMSYLEPNTYMDDVSPTYQRNTASEKKPFCLKCNKDIKPEKRHGIDYCPECKGVMGGRPKQGAEQIKTSADCVRQHTAWKNAGITPRAWSVKKVAACDDCAFFKERTCNLYHLPVVANAQELAAVINKHTAGVPAKSKRAALIQIANREPQRVENKILDRRPVTKVAEIARTKQAAAVVKEATVEDLHKQGMALEAIYCKRSSKVGSVQAGYEIKRFVASLREKGTKIALSQIDCTLLKQKLGVSNGIIGAIKCADCIYRSDMHCGLTGGTLLSFPGMERTGRKVASASPTDPSALSKEYDLTELPGQGDIELNKDREDGIEWKNPRLDDTNF